MTTSDMMYSDSLSEEQPDKDSHKQRNNKKQRWRRPQHDKTHFCRNNCFSVFSSFNCRSLCLADIYKK